MPHETLGHLFYTTSSFVVHHFKAIGEFKLELQIGNSIRVTIGDFMFHVTLKFDGWPWKTIGHLFYTALRFVFHFKAICKFKLELKSGKTLNLGQIHYFCFCSVRSRNLADELEKQQGTSHKPHQALCIISSPYVNSNWSYGSETAKLGFDLWDLDLWPLLGHHFCHW